MRKATDAEVADFEGSAYQTGRSSGFAAMADGDVWVLDGSEVDLSSRKAVSRFRTSLSMWCGRNGYTGSTRLRRDAGGDRIMVRITKRPTGYVNPDGDTDPLA